MDIDDRTCVDMTGDCKLSWLTPLETALAQRMLTGTGYSLQTEPLGVQARNGRLCLSKLGADQGGPAPVARDKRAVQHNQLFQEEPWTAASLALVRRLRVACVQEGNPVKRSKFGEYGPAAGPSSQFAAELDAVKKKLGRGDYMGVRHFENDMESIWLKARALAVAGSPQYRASVWLEIAYNQAASEQQDYKTQAKRAALFKAKASGRRRKAVLRKYSDYLESKQTADCEQPTACQTYDRSSVQVEVDGLLPRISNKDFSDVRCMMTHCDGIFPSDIAYTNRKMQHEQSNDPFMTELLTSTVHKSKANQSKRAPTKPKDNRPRKPSLIMDEVCDMNSNSSFLTGSHNFI